MSTPSSPSSAQVSNGPIKVESEKPSKTFSEEAKRLIAAKYSLIYVPTFEDARCENALQQIAKSGFQSPVKFYSWSITNGLNDGAKKVEGTEDPVAALDFVIQSKDPGLFSFKDLNKEFPNSPNLVRKLRDVYQTLKGAFKTVFVLAPTIQIPSELSKEMAILEFDLPNVTEIEKLFDATIKSFKTLQVNLTPDEKEDFIKSALGLTWDEAKNAFVHACMGTNTLTTKQLHYVIEEKCKVVRKDGILDYIPVDYSMDEIGGLDNLKEWLETRARFFTKEARSFGLSAPKGVLLTGISGCGKSSCVKAIGQYWRLPLMRLDMTKVYGGTLGNPEETMRRALKTVEAVAPVILWMEEIEKGVAGFTQGDGGVTARIFSSFLTWMQEKEAMVFVAATANEIDQLPPELLRKGRFDEIFFVDLPTEKERLEIFKVHIGKRKHPPEKFNLTNLSKATNGYNGAEIEQIVAAGMFTAFNEKRQFNDNDLYREIGKIIPLATTMAEKIKAIKRWADTRAVKASKA